MNPEPEIRYLLDVMPASGRMTIKLVSKAGQRGVIEAPFPMPWWGDRPIWINFELWSQLSRPQRDLLILRTVSWLTGIKWVQPNWYQGLVLVGLLGTVSELMQADPVGIVATGGLSAIAGLQIWRNNRSPSTQLDADEAAIQVAQRRGYTEPEAARALLSAIETVADIEGRPNLDFIELLRCQNLRAIAGLSPVGIPANLK